MCAASTVSLYKTKKIKLNNGHLMPAIGLGTFRVREYDVLEVMVDCALQNGYRMFDTAAVYHNEVHLGTALKKLLPKYDLERDDIFITTKLSPSDHGDINVVRRAFNRSLKNLDLEYINLYLMHFPGSSKFNVCDTVNREMRENTWEAMGQLLEEEPVNSIGVSNFTTAHLVGLEKHTIMPCVNQVEWHPYYSQEDLKHYCDQNNIQIQAYCSFGGQSCGNMSLLQDPLVVQISERLKVSPNQVLLAWALQQDIPVIPKAINPIHIKENINVNIVLTNDDLRALTDLRKNNVKYAWDPKPVA